MCPLWEGREGTKGSKHCMSIARHAGGTTNIAKAEENDSDGWIYWLIS
jgi:hypothetical protein